MTETRPKAPDGHRLHAGHRRFDYRKSASGVRVEAAKAGADCLPSEVDNNRVYKGRIKIFNTLPVLAWDTLRCPVCGGEYLHQGNTEIFNRSHEDSTEGLHVTVDGQKLQIDHNQSGNPSLRRDGIRIDLWCEFCDSSSSLTIVQHKGNTLLEQSIISIGEVYNLA